MSDVLPSLIGVYLQRDRVTAAFAHLREAEHVKVAASTLAPYRTQLEERLGEKLVRFHKLVS